MTKYMTPQQVCDEILPGFTPEHLAQLRFRGEGPPFRKPSERRVLYDLDEVVAWVESTKRTSTADSALAG